MPKDFDLIEFIISQTTPKKFERGGSVPGFAEGGGPDDYGEIEGQIFATKPAPTDSLGGYDLGAWDADAFLSTQANIAATAGLLEGAEVGQMQQQQDRRDIVKAALAKIGRQDKPLTDDQVNDLYNKMRSGVTLTPTLVDSYKTPTVDFVSDMAYRSHFNR